MCTLFNQIGLQTIEIIHIEVDIKYVTFAYPCFEDLHTKFLSPIGSRI